MTSQYFAFTILLCFIKIIAISCKRYGSLSLVIDDTISMQSEIDSVKKESSKFMDIILTNSSSQINDVVIVTFNDPDYIITRRKYEKSKLRLRSTTDRNEVKRALDRINTSFNRRGGDCPEYSLTGINTALQYSHKNSYLFVFTDASPKDGYNFVRKTWEWELNATLQDAEIKNVIKRAGLKESQIFFFITKGHCIKPEPEISFKPYWDIAAATNGEVFKINKKEDLEYYLNYMNIIISGEGNQITRKDLKANEIAPIPFTVDEQTQFVRVSASSQGDNVFLNISSGPTRAYEKIVWTENNKVLIINSPAPGNYSVTVQGTGYTTITVVGRTDFTFQHGFSETVPPTFSNEKPQPIEGIKSNLLVKIYDPKKSVDIKTAQISSIDEKTIYYDALALTKVSDDYYVTNSFLAPNTLFVITVIGEGKKTGVPIKRTAKTPIQPRPQDMDPLIKIQGGGKYEYNSDVLLTCSVTAYPKPKNIVWMDNEKKIIAASSVKEKKEKEYVTSYSFKNLKHETVLFCCAETVNGDIFQQRVDLDTDTAFIVNTNQSEASVVVEFGKPATLPCDIRTKRENITMKIVWYHVNNNYTELDDLSSAHSKHSISNHGRKLTINRVDEYNKGQYLCKAIIIDDKDEYYQLEREIKIQHTAPVLGNTEYIEINEGESQSLSCTILNGYPKPEIYWEFKDYKSKTFRPLHKTGDRLQINEVNHLSAGVYKCIATNNKGTATKEIKLTVSIHPHAKLHVNDKTRLNVKYNNIEGTVLTCHVLSHPSPVIVWKNGSMGTRRVTTKINDYEYISTMMISKLTKSETYYCEATNKLSTTKSNNVYVDVLSPLQKVPTALDNNMKKANYGEKIEINCGITSSFPLKITWYKDKEEVAQESDKYLIAKNGATLTIKEANTDTKGTYKCKASIIGDEATQDTREINVDIINLDPQISIEGGGKHKYNSSVMLTCNVKAYPEPKITWMDDKRNALLASPVKENKEKYFVSKLLIRNLKHKMVFYCYAESSKRKIVTERVAIDTHTPFNVNEKTTDASVVVEFGKPATLQCDVTADIPIKLVWYHIVNNVYTELKDLSSAHSEYSISNHGRKLTVNEVNQDNEGLYICKALISGDDETKLELKRNIKIEHTAPVMGNREYVEINEGESKSISCTILKGYPKPEIIWEFKDYRSKTFQPLRKTSDRFLINNAKHFSAGVYKCSASNYLGRKEHEIAVTISIRPQVELRVNGKTSTNITIEYNNIEETFLTCHVLSHSEPDIVWKNGKNEVLTTSRKTTKSNEYEYISMMKKSQLRKSETYYCEATNQISTTKSNSVYLEVSTPFSKVPPSQDNDIKKANNGEKVVIECGITSSFPNIITWYKETEVVQTSDRYLIAENGKTLTIRKMDMTTVGKYRCISTIIGDEATQETHETSVDITLENPKVETKYRDLEVFRGQNTFLNCKVLKGFPRPTITWKVKYEKSNEFVTLPDVGEVLNLSPALYNHTGEYKCVLKNNLGSDEGTVRLFVKGPPVILTPNDKPYIALVGDDVLAIPCEVAGYPKPNITWLSEYPESKTKFSVNSNGFLIIKNPTTEDSNNEFTCTATNEFDQVKKTFDTVVEQTIGDNPQYTGDITNIVVLKDTNNTHLKCESGSIKGRWFKNEDPMGITGTMTVDSVLESFDDGSSYHGTNYTCRINDITGSKSYTYNVKIEYQPILKQPIEEPIDWDGSEINLSCDVYMRPEYETAKAKWYYNGKESYLSNGRAHLSKHPIISWGNYTCIISNKHGLVKKNFYVYSSNCLIALKGMKYPLMLDIKGSWPTTNQENNLIVSERNQNLLLSCNNQPTQPNFFQKLPNETEIIATCDHEDKFIINGKIFIISDLQCNTKVTPTLKETGEKCFTENTELIKVGYNMQLPEPSFIEVYSVCFDKNKKVPIYSNSIVTQEDQNQIENPEWLTYDNYFKENIGGFCNKDTKCCLNKVQLANEMDMANKPMKLATYIDGLNSVPYWHDCSTMDYTWSDLDDILRSLWLNTPYTKISGALEYTSKNGIMVPRFLWKFVYDGDFSRLVVIVNDPSPKKEDVRCTSSCGWTGWKELSKQTFCCELDEFKEAFKLPGSSGHDDEYQFGKIFTDLQI